MKKPYIVNFPMSKGVTFQSVSGSINLALFPLYEIRTGLWPSITPSTLQMRHGSFPLSLEPWTPCTISECCMYCDAEPCDNIQCHEESGWNRWLTTWSAQISFREIIVTWLSGTKPLGIISSPKQGEIDWGLEQLRTAKRIWYVDMIVEVGVCTCTVHIHSTYVCIVQVFVDYAAWICLHKTDCSGTWSGV